MRRLEFTPSFLRNAKPGIPLELPKKKEVFDIPIPTLPDKKPIPQEVPPPSPVEEPVKTPRVPVPAGK